MEELGWSIRVVLAGAMALAGAAKLADRDGTRIAAAGFGVPWAAAGVVAVVLPPLELAIAVLLIIPATAGVSALLTAALLSAFSIAIAAAVARGRKVECRCFGAASGRPAGLPAIARNVALGVGAVVVVASPSARAVAWPSGLDGGSAAAGFAAATALGLPVVLVLLRRHGRLLERLAGSVAGHPAPDLGGPADGRPLLAIFSAESCSACTALAPRVAAWRVAHARSLAIVELDVGEAQAAARSCGITGTPAAVLVSPGGRIVRDPAHGASEVEALLAAALADIPAPALRLPDVPLWTLDGKPVGLHDALAPASRTVVVLWDERCAFCADLHDDLAVALARPGAPAVLAVVPRPPTERDLPCPTFLDPDGALISATAAPGTPSVLSMTSDGHLHGPPTAGAAAVLAAVAPLHVLAVPSGA